MNLAPELQKQIVRDIFEKGWNQQQFDDFESFLSESIKFNFRGAENITNLAHLKELIGVWRAAFPDLHFHLGEIIAEKNLAAAIMVFTGTHQGQWKDIPPTGKKIRVEEMMFFRFEQGKIVELWEVFDEREMMNQLIG